MTLKRLIDEALPILPWVVSCCLILLVAIETRRSYRLLQSELRRAHLRIDNITKVMQVKGENFRKTSRVDYKQGLDLGLDDMDENFSRTSYRRDR